jgi:hypothetical protein
MCHMSSRTKQCAATQEQMHRLISADCVPILCDHLLIIRREQLPLASSQPHDPPRGRSPSRHRSRSPQPDHAATLGVDTQQQGEQQERPAAAEAAQGLSSGSAAPGTQLLVSSQQGPGNDGPGSTSISNGSRDGSSGNNGLNSQHLAARLPSSQRSGQSPVRRPPLLGRPRSPSPIRRMSLGGSPRGGECL